ncbi:unnamed protein product [Alopecurus aequalis]
MAATTTTTRWATAVLVAAALLTATSASDDKNAVFEPCADATVQRGDGFTFGVAFSRRDAFSSGGVQLSPCDSRLNLPSVGAKVALFRPTVDEISLLTVNASDPRALENAGGYMVAFAGRKYAARSLPIFVTNNTYTVTGFTLVFEFQKGILQNLFWKPDGCSSCSSSGTQSNSACVEDSCAIKNSICKGTGNGQADCSPGIQLAFSGTDKHEAVLNSWYEVSKLKQYSLSGLFSNLKDSLASRFFG